MATLEDWFDERRLRHDYVPTGLAGVGVKTRAVEGHEYGLKLTPEDKRWLIAFLKTLSSKTTSVDTGAVTGVWPSCSTRRLRRAIQEDPRPEEIFP